MPAVKSKSSVIILIPADVRRALGKDLSKFESMPPSHRREYLRVIEDAKKPETRQRRITFLVAKMKTKD